MRSNKSSMNMSETKLLSDDRFLRRVAEHYYGNGLSQEAIADGEGCSRMTVSKALQKAKTAGIVRISILPELRGGYLRNLSREARLELGLEDLVLVPGRSFEGMAKTETNEHVAIDIAQAAAEYLDQLLVDSSILAMSGGTMMRSVTRFLRPTKMLPRLNVVSTIGFVEPHTTEGDANMVTYELAQAYGGTHTWFCAGAFFPSISQAQLKDLSAMIQQYPMVKKAYDLYEQASIFMMGLWTPYTNDEVVMKGILSQEQMSIIEKQQPAADINHWVFDAQGRCINTLLDPPPYYLTGFEIPSLKEKIQTKGVKAILVAGGGPAYVPAIHAALQAGLANILVTDHITAQYLLRLAVRRKGEQEDTVSMHSFLQEDEYRQSLR